MKLSKGWAGSLSRKGSRIKWFQSSHCIPPDAQRLWATSKTGPVGEIVMKFWRPQKSLAACGVFEAFNLLREQHVAEVSMALGHPEAPMGGGHVVKKGFLEWPSGKCTKSPWLFVFFFTGGKFLLKDLRFQSHQMVVRFFKLLGSRNTFSFSHTDACSRNTRSRSCGTGCSRNRC